MAVEVIGDSRIGLIIDPTVKAARIVTTGKYCGVVMASNSTYRASTLASFAAASGTGPFFLIYGSQDKLLTVQRIMISGGTFAGTTAVGYVDIVVQKFLSLPTAAGTAVTLTQVPLDTQSPSPSATLCNVYTAAPTAGTLSGVLGARRMQTQATTSLATNLFDKTVEWDFRCQQSENTAAQLRSGQRGLGLAFAVAPGQAITMSLEVEWTEE